ncbi:MAG: MFS transporter [Spirochaetes bacterium]|nr:MFS transporter [Spirochaetota bacterium]
MEFIINEKIKKDIFRSLTFFQIFAMFRRGLFYSYMTIYLRYYIGLSITETTLFSTIPMILNSFFQTFIWGPYSDKTKKRKNLIIIGELLAAFGTILVWYMHYIVNNLRNSGLIIIIGMSIVEIFWSMSNLGWAVYISDVYLYNERTLIQTKFISSGAIGRMIGVFAAGFLYDLFGLKYEGYGFREGLLFFLSSFFMVFSVIPLFKIPDSVNIYRKFGNFNLENKNNSKNNNSLDNKFVNYSNYLDESNINELKLDYSYKKEQLLINLFIVFIISLVFINFGRNSISSITNQYLKSPNGFNLSSQMLSYIINFYSLGLFMMSFFIKSLTNKFKDEILFIFGLFLAFLYLAIYVFSKKVIFIFLANLLNGISENIISSTSYTIVSKIIPYNRRGKLFGYYNSTFFLSWGVASTILIAPIADIIIKSGKSDIHGYKGAFMCSIFLLFIGIIIFIIFLNKIRKIRTYEN